MLPGVIRSDGSKLRADRNRSKRSGRRSKTTVRRNAFGSRTSHALPLLQRRQPDPAMTKRELEAEGLPLISLNASQRFQGPKNMKEIFSRQTLFDAPIQNLGFSL
jgi:hypothetical protein